MKRFLAFGSLALVAAGLASSGAVQAGAPPLPGGSIYSGRWTVDEARQVFTARGRPYKTIDVAPCGQDFCGVSVSDRGACGVVLFRITGRLFRADTVEGRGRWGDGQKTLIV